MMETKTLIPAWTYEEKACPPPCIFSCFSFGVLFLLIGSVLTSMYRKIPWATDIAMCGVALIVLGTVLVIGSSLLGVFLVITKQRLPKTSSAAKADVPPDPFSLVPVYPRPSSRNAGCSPQILLLPGAIDPIYSAFGT